MLFSSRLSGMGLKVLIMLLTLLPAARLKAADADPFVVGSIVERAQLNKTYDASNDWYTYQWYTRDAAISMADYDATTARRLVLEFNYYVEDLDATDEIPEIFTGGNGRFNDFIELGFGNNNQPGFTWHLDRSAIRQGWNKLQFPFTAISDADMNSKFSSDKKFVWFRLCFAHLKTEHAYLMRMSDVRVIDPEREVPVLRTEYDEPIMNTDTDPAKQWTGTVNVRKDLPFWSAVDYKTKDGLDLSNMDLSKVFMEFDLEITENQEGAFEDLKLADPRIFQVHFASVRNTDNQEIGYKSCGADAPQLGAHHYSFNISALAGNAKHDLSHMRFYGLTLTPQQGLTTDKTCKVVLTNPRITLRKDVTVSELCMPSSAYGTGGVYNETWVDARDGGNGASKNPNLWSAFRKGSGGWNGFDLTGFDLENGYYQFDFEVIEQTPGSVVYLNDMNYQKNGGGTFAIGSGYNPDDRTIKQQYNYKLSDLGITFQAGKNTVKLPLSAAIGKIDFSDIGYLHFQIFGSKSTPEEYEALGCVPYFSVRISDVKFVNGSGEVAERITVPTIFGSNMIFQQKKPINIWGYGTEGSNVTVTLKRGENIIASAQSTITDGRWDVRLPAQDASFDPMQVVITNGTQTIELVNILVGEVWVAGGQSNMALNVGGLQKYLLDELQAEPVNQNIRIFIEPTKPTGTVSPYVPEKDINGAYWIKPDNFEQVKGCSAVAYYMARDLQPKLNVPVGILYTPVGGSIIEAWIPREEIESDEFAETRNLLKREGAYYDETFWVDGDRTLTGFYNSKIGPLAGFNVAGAVWYQGESNSDRANLYSAELVAMKKGWSRTFGFDEAIDPMPFVYCQVAPWVTDTDLMLIAEAMTDAYTKMADRRVAMFPIYDTDLTQEGNVTIHPTNKKPVGKRFATAVYNMVYDPAKPVYSAPVVDEITFGEGVAKVTFKNAGEGLRTIDGGSDVIGFTVAGTNGQHVNTDAHITDKNTVEVSLAGVKDAKYISYAWRNFNINSNLCNSAAMPAAPFRNNATDRQTQMRNMDWLEMDAPTVRGYVWGQDLPTLAAGWIGGDNATWTSDDAEITFDTADRHYGLASMNVKYSGTKATVSAGVDSYTMPADAPANASYNKTLAVNLSGFTGMRVMVKNTDARDKSLTFTVTAENNKVYTLTAPVKASTNEFKPVYFDFSKLQEEVGARAAYVPTLGRIRSLDFTVTDTEAGSLKLDHATMLTLPDDMIPTGIADIAVDPEGADETWYTTQGIRVSGRPTAPGLYVSDRSNKLVVR